MKRTMFLLLGQMPIQEARESYLCGGVTFCAASGGATILRDLVVGRGKVEVGWGPSLQLVGNRDDASRRSALAPARQW
jgi:hypothetical protein